MLFEKKNYDQEQITKISRLLIKGTHLYISGLDRYFWYQNEIYPGIGAIAEQIKFMTRSEISVLGKPSNTIFELAIHGEEITNDILFVGDDYDVDIIGAKKFGLHTIYIANETIDQKLNLQTYADETYKNFKDFIDDFI